MCRTSTPLAASAARQLRRQRRHLPLAELLHHLLHLLAGGEELVDLVDRGAAAGRDPPASRPVDHVWDAALGGRHREHDRLDPRHLLLVDVEPVELLADAGQELEDALDRPHAPQHPVALEEVVKRELAGPHAALHLRLLIFGDNRFGLLDQRQHVAHAQDA